jgi:hypothetical protein
MFSAALVSYTYWWILLSTQGYGHVFGTLLENYAKPHNLSLLFPLFAQYSLIIE